MRVNIRCHNYLPETSNYRQLFCTDAVICLYTTVPVAFRLPFLCIFTTLEVPERYLPIISEVQERCSPASQSTATAFRPPSE